jgi:hypothetical protein
MNRKPLQQAAILLGIVAFTGSGDFKAQAESPLEAGSGEPLLLQSLPTAGTAPAPEATSIPVIVEPGATTTNPASAAALATPAGSQRSSEWIEPTTAQLPQLVPGRATRSGSSYLGGGLNVGVAGDTALGDRSFSVISKIGLTRSISFRPGAVVDFPENVTVLAPLTLDLPLRQSDGIAGLGFRFAPYLGGGLAASTNGHLGPLVTGGIDIPLTSRFTANAALNLGLLDEANVGLSIGVGYTIPGF